MPHKLLGDWSETRCCLCKLKLWVAHVSCYAQAVSNEVDYLFTRHFVDACDCFLTLHPSLAHEASQLCHVWMEACLVEVDPDGVAVEQAVGRVRVGVFGPLPAESFDVLKDLLLVIHHESER